MPFENLTRIPIVHMSSLVCCSPYVYIHQEKAKDGRIAVKGVWTPRGSGTFWENWFRIPANPINTNVMMLDGKVRRNLPSA